MTTLVEPFEVLCEDTSALPRHEWLAMRRFGLGSSDAAPALNLSPWRSQYEVWAEKRGHLADRADNPRFRGGRAYEEPTLRLWCEDSDTPFESVQRHKMIRSVASPFMIANPDGLTDDAVIEVKTAHSMDERRWDAGVPDQYVVQGLHLLYVSGRRRCVFPVAFGWEGPVEFSIDLDGPDGASLQESMAAMVTIEAELWQRIQANNPPDPDGSESSMMALREQFFEVEYDTVVQLPQEAGQWLLLRQAALDAQKSHDDDINHVKALLMKVLGAADAGELDGRIAVTWRANKNGTRVLRFPGGES